MSAEEPTTHEERTPRASVVKPWKELEDRTGGDVREAETSTPSQIESQGNEGGRRKRLASRRARLLLAGVLAVLVAAPALIAIASLTGAGSAPRLEPRSGAVHANEQKTKRRSSGRAPWVREAGKSPRPRQKRAAPAQSRARRHVQPRDKPRRAARRPEGAVGPPSESVPASPEPTPAPIAPAPSEHEEGPGLRDGATESTEFGL